MACGDVQRTSFKEHDGAGTADIIGAPHLDLGTTDPGGRAALRKGLAQKHTQCKDLRCVTASDDGLVGYAYGMYEVHGTGFSMPRETALAKWSMILNTS
jgi:hypothetical protein